MLLSNGRGALTLSHIFISTPSPDDRSTWSCQATVYGQCVASKYTDTSKGMCEDQFRAFSKCVKDAVSLPSFRTGVTRTGS